MRSPATEATPVTLSAEDYASLRRWERKMVYSFLAIMIGLFTVLGFDFVVGLAPGMAGTLFVVMLLIVIYGGRLQFSQKCPGCGARLGFQTRLTLPEQCRRCRVSLKEPQA